jgi:predicted  nucleic acid-binding Zn-ribbon protein
MISALPSLEAFAKVLAILLGAVAVVLVPIGTIIVEMRKARATAEATVPAKVVNSLQPAMSVFGDMLMMDGLRNSMATLRETISELNSNIEALSRRIESGTDAVDDLRKAVRADTRQRVADCEQDG